MFLLARSQVLRELHDFTRLVESREGSLVVLVGQGIGHTRHHLLPGSLHLGSEFTAKVVGQHNNQHVAQELWERREK